MASAMMSEAARKLFTNFILLFSCLAYQATRDSSEAVASVGSNGSTLYTPPRITAFQGWQCIHTGLAKSSRCAGLQLARLVMFALWATRLAQSPDAFLWLTLRAPKWRGRFSFDDSRLAIHDRPGISRGYGGRGCFSQDRQRLFKVVWSYRYSRQAAALTHSQHSQSRQPLPLPALGPCLR
ncbi:hypothetical protein D3C78_1066290 [compost metagenome]